MKANIANLGKLIREVEEKYRLPLKANSDADTRLVYLKSFRQYINDLKDSNLITDSDVDFVEKTGQKINEAWQNFNKGKIQTASSQVRNLLFMKTKKNRPLIDYLLVSFDHNHLEEAGNCSLQGFYAEGFQRLFRARVRDNAEFHEKDMYHIPFNYRNKVANQRYSLSGFPCLYLGASVYACWLELDKPSFDCLNIIRYQAIKGMKYIDLSLTPTNCLFLAELLAAKKDWNSYVSVETQIIGLYERCLFAFPLMLACSIINVNRTASDNFRNEYVIPQLLMHSIADGKKGINTVKYLSTKVVGRAEPWAEFSLAIIPKQNKVNEVLSSDLATSFAVTNAVNARLLLDMVLVEEGYSNAQRERAISEKLYLPAQSSAREYRGIRKDVFGEPLQVTINCQFREYHHTPFGKIESALINTGARKLTDLLEAAT